MRKLLPVIALLAATPGLMLAGPNPGDPAPRVTLPDTAWSPHVIPDDYRGHVMLLFFWQST